MRVTKILFFVFLLSAFGCDDSQEVTFCNVDSVYDLEWLREEMESKGYFEPLTGKDVLVYSATYLNKEVVYIVLCCPDCLVVPPKVRACNGVSLGSLDSDIDRNLLANKKVIWRTHNGGSCQ